ncbi:MAG: serine palmitoyltransferase component, partial [Chaenotheca gracillima]
MARLAPTTSAATASQRSTARRKPTPVPTPERAPVSEDDDDDGENLPEIADILGRPMGAFKLPGVAPMAQTQPEKSPTKRIVDIGAKTVKARGKRRVLRSVADNSLLLPVARPAHVSEDRKGLKTLRKKEVVKKAETK